MNKNEEYTVDVVDNGFAGEGIAKIEDKTVFIPNAISGEKVKIKILKVNKNIAYGKIIEIITPSILRENPDCKYYEKCGGCNYRHIKYNASLDFKKKAVQSTLRKSLGETIQIDDVIGMSNPFYYRNKLQYPVGVNNKGETIMGIYAERSHRIVEVSECKIQNKTCQKVADDTFNFLKQNNIPGYNEETKEGYIRHIIVRIGIKTNEVMLTLVTNEFNIPKEKELVNYVLQNNPEVKTIVKNLNNQDTNVILGNKMETIYGDGYIYDYIGNKKFKISSNSFYQVNPIQTEKLYNKAIEYAELTGKETVVDLYCGIGTIGICASDKAKMLYGIEIVEQAIEDAKENAKINNIKNANFFAGDAKNVLSKLVNEKGIKPDVIFLDPPRKGCDKETIDTILQIKANKVIYVSCNPATLARDLKLLEKKYKIEKMTLCDMFPRNISHRISCIFKFKINYIDL